MHSLVPVHGAPSRSAGLLLACGLALLLLLISMGRLGLDLGRTAFNVDIVHHAMGEPIWKTRLGINLGVFAIAITALHLAFGVLCWVLARFSEFSFPRARCSRRNWILVWFLVGTVWVLIANAARFPRSSLGQPYHALASQEILGISPLAAATSLVFAGVVAVVALAAIRRPGARKLVMVSVGAVGLLGVAGKHGTHTQPATEDAPHVILVGIDSLRPDAIQADTTPNLQHFMSGAVQWTDAITPLARTFPSWAALLTGRHPHTTGAFMNLLPRERINTGVTLPQRLQDHGYRTYYGIDETRFSNIDASYGFDATMTPTIGGSDFMLTRIADTPLSNLVMNTRIGALLFPHIYANRAAAVVYNPDSFVQRIGRETDFRKPAFVAVHLTLPHWPYTWADSTTDTDQDSKATLYLDSVRRADRQFGDLLAQLERRGVLQNAIVIALSDHGEALGQADDFMVDAFPSKDKQATNYQRWGHGTSVFSPSQYRVVLAFRAYGAAAWRLDSTGRRNEPVSLMDVAPTVLDLLDINTGDSFDGISIAPLMRPYPAAGLDLEDRIRFTESEYNPQGFDPREFTVRELAEAARVYRLDPSTDRITVREDMLDSIMATRQYAALLGSRLMAAAVPGLRDDGRYELVFVRHPESQTANLPDDEQRLRDAMEQRFGLDLSEPDAR